MKSAATLTNLEESVHQLWTLQPQAEIEAKFLPEIHVLNSNSQDSFSGSVNTGVDPNYKLFFRKMFDPKTPAIAVFLTIYETDMCQAPEKLKKPILTCIHLMCQEMMAQIKETLIEELGEDLSLEFKKDVFMHIWFNPSETLAVLNEGNCQDTP
ncbi:hypothetical protein DSO57_1012390 [Entomophthora muscae]|uniref:Uncharacterized protein n=1 Tax=Entomophthora muscae TaxID=34485 RepID=A0ACC2UGT6_9FUNG|nr:hypothetical protein DSO57_1012390 [Entomophthora muscae]